jgi:hypothetical protein
MWQWCWYFRNENLQKMLQLAWLRLLSVCIYGILHINTVCVRAHLECNSPSNYTRETCFEHKLYKRNETYFMNIPHPHPVRVLRISRRSMESRRARTVTLCVNAESSLCNEDVWGRGSVPPRINYVEGHKWSASRPYRFTPEERNLDTHSMRGWVGPGAGLDPIKKSLVSKLGTESRFLGRPAHSLVTVKTKLIRIFPKLFALLGKPLSLSLTHTHTHTSIPDRHNKKLILKESG